VKNVILTFGASGSGTSTLGQKICGELGYTWMDTDDYFWMPTTPPFTQKRPREERIELIKKDIDEAENAVLSGSIAGWGDALIPYFTLAVRIEMDHNLRMERLKNREKQRFGSRIDPGGDMYEHHLAFVEWAKTYDTGGVDVRSKAKHDVWQKLLPCGILCLDGADSVEDNFAKVKNMLKQ
jgi:adenylate kinase family enzyme